MANGTVDALGNIVCPLHRYKFSMVNGRNVSGEGYHLKTWKVEWREDGVWIDLPEAGDGRW
jgi:3-phenylpropionate/trans-cinnamate dioxygenase ferredoxin subunit